MVCGSDPVPGGGRAEGTGTLVVVVLLVVLVVLVVVVLVVVLVDEVGTLVRRAARSERAAWVPAPEVRATATTTAATRATGGPNQTAMRLREEETATSVANVAGDA